MEIARTILISSKFPKSLWTKALKTTAYILSWVPTNAVAKTPFELFKGCKLSLRYMCVWGCRLKWESTTHKKRKPNPRTISGYFIGYAEKSKGYRFYYPSDGTRIVELRNAKFLETDLISGSDQSQNLVFVKDQPSISTQRLVIIHNTPQGQPDVEQPIIEDPQTADDLPVD